MHKILRQRQVTEITGIGRAGLYNLTDSRNRSYDPTFPRPIKLGLRAVGYIESEIMAWIDQQASRQRGGACTGQPRGLAA